MARAFGDLRCKRVEQDSQQKERTDRLAAQFRKETGQTPWPTGGIIIYNEKSTAGRTQPKGKTKRPQDELSWSFGAMEGTRTP